MGRVGGRQSGAPPAELQAACRHLAASVCRGLPPRTPESPTSGRCDRDRSTRSGGSRLRQPPLSAQAIALESTPGQPYGSGNVRHGHAPDPESFKVTKKEIVERISEESGLTQLQT